MKVFNVSAQWLNLWVCISLFWSRIFSTACSWLLVKLFSSAEVNVTCSKNISTPTTLMSSFSPQPLWNSQNSEPWCLGVLTVCWPMKAISLETHKTRHTYWDAEKADTALLEDFQILSLQAFWSSEMLSAKRPPYDSPMSVLLQAATWLHEKICSLPSLGLWWMLVI